MATATSAIVALFPGRSATRARTIYRQATKFPETMIYNSHEFATTTPVVAADKLLQSAT
jgi:hypothetical protein